MSTTEKWTDRSATATREIIEQGIAGVSSGAPRREPTEDEGRIVPSNSAELAGCSDEELISAAQDGASSAMGELLMRHRPMVYRTALRLSRNAEEAEDVVQETMFRAFVNIRRFRKEARFSSWLVAIAINEALSKKRRERGVVWAYLDEFDENTRTHGWDLPDTRRNPEQEYIREELHRLLRHEVQRLHPEVRVVLRARILDEWSVEELAQALGITNAAAKSRLHRARTMLSRAVRRHTGMCKQERTAIRFSPRQKESRQ